jgi:hypothetical protein
MRVAAYALLTCLVLFFSPAGAEGCKKLRGFWLELKPVPEGYLVPMAINGAPHFFLLSLEEPFAAIDSKLAETLALPTRAPDLTVKHNGKLVKRVATASTIQLGVLPRQNAEFLVIDHDGPWPANADGLIGMNVIGGLDMELDLAHNRLGLFLPDHCTFEPFWKYDTLGSAPFSVNPVGTFLVPMKLDGRDVVAGLGSTMHQADMTGYAARILFGIDAHSEGIMQGGKDAAGRDLLRYPFKTLTAGGVTINNPQIFIHPEDKTPCGGIAGERYQRIDGKFCWGGADITLGLPQLTKLRFFFDFRRVQVYFTEAEPQGK